MLRRRRPLLRAAAVGGAAYYAGKKAQAGQDGEVGPADDELEAPGEESGDEAGGEDTGAAATAGITDAEIEQLKKLAELKEQGVLTDEEFETQKQKILGM